MQQTLEQTAPYCPEHFLSSTNLALIDDAVAEVFRTLLGFTVEVNPSAPQAPKSRTAIVGFSGAMRGYCAIRLDTAAASAIASAMLGGMPIDEQDESINDGAGEICNMVAGGWKNRIPELSSLCSLSPPTVISGSDYKVHTVKPSLNLSRSYQFDGHILEVILDQEQRAAD